MYSPFFFFFPVSTILLHVGQIKKREISSMHKWNMLTFFSHVLGVYTYGINYINMCFVTI